PRLRTEWDPERRLTIGLLSPDFRAHSCAYFIEPLLEALDRSHFKTIAYSSTIFGDDTTRRLRALVDQWREVSSLDDAALAEQVAQDRIDIAIDLAGHSTGSRLAALSLRPAPIAATYLGYPNTTGMAGVD